VKESVSAGSAAIISAVAVATCSAAPEFIWQGFKVVAAHFSLATIVSALLVALILVFFVEPILEHLRLWLGGDSSAGHGRRRHLVIATLVGIFIALMSVGLHDAMSAFTAGEGHEGRAGFEEALIVTLAWGAVPFAVTLAWQTAAGSRLLAVLVGIAAAASSFAAGWYFDWGLTSTLTTAIPCLAIQFFGYRIAVRGDGSGFARYAPTLATVAIVWLVFAVLFDIAVAAAHAGWLTLYDGPDYAIDVRFYIGWFLGLILTRPPADRPAVQQH
jgi:hypothetical protein